MSKKLFGLATLSFVSLLTASPTMATTVQWNLRSYVGTGGLNRKVNVRPALPVQDDGTNFVVGVPTSLQPTNGLASALFHAGDYYWGIEGIPIEFKMSVFNTNVVMDARLLTTGAQTYTYTNPATGGQSVFVAAATNIFIVTNGTLLTISATGGSGNALTNNNAGAAVFQSSVTAASFVGELKTPTDSPDHVTILGTSDGGLELTVDNDSDPGWHFGGAVSSDNGFNATSGTGFNGIGSGLTALNASAMSSGTVPAARGGAGAINGILKANGSGVVSAATDGGSLTNLLLSQAAYASGTAATLTTTAALLNFGGTKPAITIPVGGSGTWAIRASVYLTCSADYGEVSDTTVTFKLRKTTGTAADVANAIRAILFPADIYSGDIITFAYTLPEVIVTLADSDVVQLWGSFSPALSAGTLTVKSAEVVAVRIR